MATTDTDNHAGGVKRIPQRRDSTYQFPVYRWLSWLTIAGYTVGLGCMYVLMGMFGIPAPIGWAALVILFCVGIALLERPKALLTAMLFYFLLMPSNRLFGLLGLPLPGFIDELFFVPFIAVIVMSWIQRNEFPSGLWFPMAFLGVAVVSWYVNGKPSVFGVVRVSLVMLKFWIIWYFCRLTCVFENMDQFWRWGRFYIYFAAAQFLYNCLWQGGSPLPPAVPDRSGGVFGPDGTGAAHFVGYISVLALFLLAGWWGTEGRRATKRRKAWMAFLGLVITYDLAFMTDTKHALVLLPIPFAIVLFHRSVSAKMRLGLISGGLVVGMAGALYLGVMTKRFEPMRMLYAMLDSPKGEAYLAVTRDFPYLVPYPIFGAAPGRFFSQQAAEAGAPLTRRYVIPYTDELARARMTHTRSTRTGASILGSPVADSLTLMGEFGWLGTLLYVAFMGWVLCGLWQKASRAPPRSGAAVVYLGLAGGTLFLNMTMLFAGICTVQCVMFPWWMLIGRIWDMPMGDSPEGEKASEPTVAALFPAMEG